jgi:hypothetical protein
LVYLPETLLKDICRKIPYGFPCGTDGLLGRLKLTHIAFLSSGERKRKRMMQDQMSMEGVAKWRPVVLPAPLGQAQSDVRGRCSVAAVSSSCTKAQDTTN